MSAAAAVGVSVIAGAGAVPALAGAATSTHAVRVARASAAPPATKSATTTVPSPIRARTSGWASLEVPIRLVPDRGLTVDRTSLAVSPSGRAYVSWFDGTQSSAVVGLAASGPLVRVPTVPGIVDQLAVSSSGIPVALGHTMRERDGLWTAPLRNGRWRTTTRLASRGAWALSLGALPGGDVLVGMEEYSTRTTIGRYRFGRLDPARDVFKVTGELAEASPQGLGAPDGGVPIDAASGSGLLATRVFRPGVPKNGLDEATTSPALLVIGGANGATTIESPEFAERVVASDGERVAVAGINANTWGDAGARGTPTVALGTTAALGDPVEVPAKGPRRGVHVRATFVPGGPLIVAWIEKPGPKGFSVVGTPHWAAIDRTSGRLLRQGTLSRAEDAQGIELTTVGGRVAAAWAEGSPSGRTSTLRLATLDGRTTKAIPSPTGHPVGPLEYGPSFQLAGGTSTLAISFVDGVSGAVRAAVRRVR